MEKNGRREKIRQSYARNDSGVLRTLKKKLQIDNLPTFEAVSFYIESTIEAASPPEVHNLQTDNTPALAMPDLSLITNTKDRETVKALLEAGAISPKTKEGKFTILKGTLKVIYRFFESEGRAQDNAYLFSKSYLDFSNFKDGIKTLDVYYRQEKKYKPIKK
jgi:hypothetical protein